MIDPKELRIGNWVEAVASENYHCYVRPFMIETIFNDPNCANPIILTPDILVKCGFKKENGTPFHTIQLPLNICGLSINPNNGMVWLKKNDNLMNPIGGKFLHQLQNLYFILSGEELQYAP